MPNVKLLDCTLRDGGYINRWKFGQKAIRDILFGLSVSRMNIVECGFLTDCLYDPDASLFSGTQDIGTMLQPGKNGSLYVAMIAIGEMELDPAQLPPVAESPIGGVRLTFRQGDVDKAFVYGQTLLDKGYKLFMQPVGTTNYTDAQMIDLIRRVNELNPYAFYIVDTLGMMYTKDLIRQFYLVDHNLASGIRVGYHSHNNLQMAFANAQALIESGSARELILDCSCSGMGRGAGNLCTELMMDYMNKYRDAHYDILPVLEIIDQYLIPILIAAPWGYSPAYYLAASNKCHPNYASFLLTNHSMNVRTIASVLDKIPQENRRYFDKNLIEALYRAYQDNAVDDIAAIGALRQRIGSREVLVIAPGQSFVTQSEKIIKYVWKKKPFIIAVNFIPSQIILLDTDLIFVGNNRRYEEFADLLDTQNAVFTSNIKDVPAGAMLVNYSDLTNPSPDASDNSGIMVLKLLIKLGIKQVALAGYDGFSRNQANNYALKSLAGLSDPTALAYKSRAIGEQLNICAQSLQIKFVTSTRYRIKRK